MSRRLSFQVEVVIRPYDDGSGWIAICPALLGAMVDGDTEAEALDAIRERVADQLSLHLRSREEVPWIRDAAPCFCKRRRIRLHFDAESS